MIAVAGNAKTFWYLTRGTGIVALLLLTASVALGVLTTSRWRTPRWPRFALSAVHRNLTLLTLVFIVVHVVTTVLDGYAPIRLVDAVVPFVSAYRPVWLGLGAVAFDLLLALVVYEPAAGAPRLPPLAADPLARLRLVARRARPCARHRQRRPRRLHAACGLRLARDRRPRRPRACSDHAGPPTPGSRGRRDRGARDAARDRRLVPEWPGEARLGKARRHAGDAARRTPHDRSAGRGRPAGPNLVHRRRSPGASRSRPMRTGWSTS